ncbi:hypothetical protein J2776_004009 [Paraburkholderia caledonica]|jgi:hypothetical protein|uniref:Uncharacterized protein n=1 Tax=Paraburkholderia caledonica TaxID=134536 RepID=A0ABU1L260_9BURK|nr:hypothetical protein [Paraburkholderia caledonica]MDR7004672.1 hypothetical protein [Paraburkholderia strydomiana]
MKKAFVFALLFVIGAVGGGLVGLYIALPSQTLECGDACGTRALVFALRCGLVFGLLLAVVGGVITKKYRARQSGRQW